MLVDKFGARQRSDIPLAAQLAGCDLPQLWHHLTKDRLRDLAVASGEALQLPGQGDAGCHVRSPSVIECRGPEAPTFQRKLQSTYTGVLDAAQHKFQ